MAASEISIHMSRSTHVGKRIKGNSSMCASVLGFDRVTSISGSGLKFKILFLILLFLLKPRNP